jgi:hypothetical protein
MNFSERNGLKPSPTQLMPGQMPQQLRASLWNTLHIALWDTDGFMYSRSGMGTIDEFSKALWFQHFKLPFSKIPGTSANILKTLEQHFFGCSWNEVYDFLEATMSISKGSRLQLLLNVVLERELAAYRIVDGRFVQITSETELAALTEALSARDRFAPTVLHLQRALELLSDRSNPDFRNSIKESVSAVEACARTLTGRENATLGDALKLLEKDHGLHKALKDGFSKLYGYTSDEHGIRHAMHEEPSLGIAEAKFFLLSCTSFINYLKSSIEPPAA